MAGSPWQVSLTGKNLRLHLHCNSPIQGKGIGATEVWRSPVICDRHAIGEVWRMAHTTDTAKSDINGIPETNRSSSPEEDEDKYGLNTSP